MKKQSIVYLIGAIIAVIGLIMKLLGFSLGLFLLLGGIAFIVISFISIKLISASKSATEGENLSLEMKINNALTKARQDKFKAESEIRRLTSYAQDTILTTYSSLFPDGNLTTQKSELLEKYDDIKKEYGEKLSFEMMDKCDNLVNGYKNQIELHDSKIKVFEKLQDEYTALKEKIRVTKQKERQMQQLEKHDEKLKAAQENMGAIAAEIEHEYTMDDLSKEVAYKEEYMKQLEQLSYQYGDDVSSNNAISYKTEVDNILKGLETKNS